MLTTGTTSNESFVVTSSSAQFPLLSNSAFSSCDGDQQHLHSVEQSGQLQFQQSQMLLQHNQPFRTASDQSTSFNDVAPPNQFATLFPTNVSLSPPSPADSGVLSDSKSDLGSINPDGVGIKERLKMSPNSINLANTDTVDAIVSSLAGMNLLNVQDGNLETSNDLLQNLIQSNSSASASNNLGLSSKNYVDNNCVTISQDLATIWSPPTAVDKPAGYDLALQASMLQALQEQEQQMENWSNASMSGSAKPPPGLSNIPLLHKHLQTQSGGVPQVNGLPQKLPLRRSQSVMLNRSNIAPYLPGRGDGLDELSEHLLNSSLTSQSSPYSAWSNDTPSLSSTNLLSSLNSAQLRTGSSIFTKPSFAHHMMSPPKLHRSISTPAKHTSPFSVPGVMPSLDDNPFFKPSAVPALNGHAALTGNSHSQRFNDFDATLSEIMKSNAISQQRAFLPAPQSTRGLGKWKELGSGPIFEEGLFAPSLAGNTPSFFGEANFERFSRKVFVGGLPPDIDEEEIRATFMHFGSLVVDWPHKAESKSYFPPKGYAFLLFKEEISVQNLIRCCLKEGDKLYLRVSSPTIRDKPVQIRPWKLTDSDFVLDGSQSLDPRKTVFVGGVPRPLRAFELAILMDRLYGGVCYAGIDVDPDLKYPKGAGRVAFSNQQSYIAAISARFAHLQHADIDKRVEVKPYVLDDQHCDECQGARCGGRFAPFFCANVACLRYYCDECWVLSHSRAGMDSHRPLVKEGAERFARSTIGRW